MVVVGGLEIIWRQIICNLHGDVGRWVRLRSPLSSGSWSRGFFTKHLIVETVKYRHLSGRANKQHRDISGICPPLSSGMRDGGGIH